MPETPGVSPLRLRTFFGPSNIALVGATEKSRWSVNTFTNLKNFAFAGHVYCVNPHREFVHGQRTYASLCDIPEHVDLAYVMVPTSQIMQVLNDAANASVENLVVLTAGFSETGPDGTDLERQVAAFARAHNQVILGPNGNGFVYATKQLTPYGLPVVPPLISGPIGIVLQSGALASSVMTLAQARSIGISLLVAVGNEMMISATDVMDYLVEDPCTKVITVFLESIRDAKEFSRVAKKALSKGKAIVALKIGRSVVSARTARAHTGALVGDDDVNDAVFRQLGIVRVDSLEDLLTTAGVLGYAPPLMGRRVAVVTPSGGACDILADRAADEHLQLPPFSPSSVAQLKDVVPTFSTVHNPLDVTGYVVVDRTLLLRALEVVAKDDGFDFILCLTEPPRTEPEDPAAVFEQFSRLQGLIEQCHIPIVLMMNTAVDISPFGRSIVEKTNLHFIGGMQHGMTALGKAVWWYENRRTATFELPDRAAIQSSGIEGPPKGSWSEYKARQFLEQAGIPVVPAALVTTAEEAALAAKAIGFPVAMKIHSEDIAHKSDVGGVVLDVQNERDVSAAFKRMVETVSLKSPSSRIEGVLVSPMRRAGTELLVGIVKDPLWGQVLAVGLGGIFVEVLKDTVIRVLPVSREDVLQMLRDLRGADVLMGSRGRVVANMDNVVDVIYRLSLVAMNVSDSLQALEVNPLWVSGSTVEALDVLLTWG